MHGVGRVANIKLFKEAVAKKCRQCVGPYSSRYEATPAELIDVCDKRTCGLYLVRPRIPKAVGQEQIWLKEILNDL